MRRLFILRPEPGASASAERAKAMGVVSVAMPLFEIAPVEWDPPEAASFDALLLTSANALRCAGEKLRSLRGLPAYAVGEATAAAARHAGFDIAGSGDAGIERLLGSIESDLELLHLCGEHRRSIEQAPQRITSLVVYRAEPLADPDGLQALHGQVAAVHSPRAAQRLGELVEQSRRRDVRIAGISEAAIAAAGDGWERAQAASSPTDEALLEVARRLCED